MDCIKGCPNAHAELLWCDRCHYGAVHPIPSIEEVSEFYQLDRYYTQGETHFEGDGQVTVLDRLRVHLAWRLDRGTPLSARQVDTFLGFRKGIVCDLGCGDGHLAAELTRLGYQVVGVEVDPNAVSRQHGSRFEVFAGTAESLPGPVSARRFDCVILSHVLEHCRDPMQALHNARKLLAPGGKLLCEVPNNNAAAVALMGCSWAMFDVPRHLHFFTSQSLARACELSGFRVKQTYYAHYTRQFSNGWINTERKLWRNLMEADSLPSPRPTQNSKWLAWKLLAQTIFAARERKYDSAGVVAEVA